MLNLFRPFGYLETTMRQKRLIKVFWVLVFFVAWQYWPGYNMPRPLGTWEEFLRLYNNGILIDVWVSTWTIIRAAFFIALPLGLVLSYLYTIEFFRPPIALLASHRNASRLRLYAPSSFPVNVEC